jgi:hypothetical protein
MHCTLWGKGSGPFRQGIEYGTKQLTACREENQDLVGRIDNDLVLPNTYPEDTGNHDYPKDLEIGSFCHLVIDSVPIRI